MRKKQSIKDFNYYIDEYMYNCRSRKLRPKTMASYEQTLRLFERWCAPAKVEAIILSDILGDPVDMIASGPTGTNVNDLTVALILP